MKAVMQIAEASAKSLETLHMRIWTEKYTTAMSTYLAYATNVLVPWLFVEPEVFVQAKTDIVAI